MGSQKGRTRLSDFHFHFKASFPGGTTVKNPPANAGDAEDRGFIPGSGRAPGVGNGTYSSILAWEMPWTEVPGGLPFMESRKLDTTEHTFLNNFHPYE